MGKNLNLRIGEHIGISLLTKNKVKSKGSAVSDHLLPFFIFRKCYCAKQGKSKVRIGIERNSPSNER